MKPKTLREKHIVELNGRLRPLSTPQTNWICVGKHRYHALSPMESQRRNCLCSIPTFSAIPLRWYYPCSQSSNCRFQDVMTIRLRMCRCGLITSRCWSRWVGTSIRRSYAPPPSSLIWHWLCSLSLCYHLLVGVDDVCYLLGVLAYSVGECSALDNMVVVKRDFNGGYLLVADVGGEGQCIFFEKIFGCTGNLKLIKFKAIQE